MFDNISFKIHSAWSGEFQVIQEVITGYFGKRKDYKLEVIGGSDIRISSDLPTVYCSCMDDEVLIIIETLCTYEDIALVTHLFKMLESLFNKTDANIKLKSLYADFNFKEISLPEAIRIIKLSYSWQKYNYAFVDLDLNSSEFTPLPIEFIKSIKRMRYTATLEDVKLVWLLTVQKPIIDITPYLLSNENSIIVYLGKNISMLDVLIRYYHYFFSYAFKYNSYLNNEFPKDELNSFRIKLRGITDKSDECKIMRRKLYSKLGDLKQAA